MTSMRRRRRETRLQVAARIGDAYGLVLILTLTTFLVTMTLPEEGWGGRVAAVAAAVVTSLVAFKSSDVSAARMRLAVVAAAAAVTAVLISAAASSDAWIGVAFVIASLLLAVSAGTILRRILGSIRVDFRTILGAISVYALLGLLFGFLYLATERWGTSPFFTGVTHPHSSDFLFFSYTTLTTTGYGNLIPAGKVGQSLAVFEMLFGQVFLVTLVAGLVSLWRPRDGAGAGEAEQ
jgi:hypothetical protein